MRSVPRAVPALAAVASLLGSSRAYAQAAPPPPPPPPPAVVAPAPPTVLVPVAPESAPPPPTHLTPVAPAAAPATTVVVAPASGGPTIQLTTLREMREKGIITEAEYQSALRDVVDTTGAKGAESNTFVVGKWSTTLYGFVEADYIFDSTESYQDLSGNSQIQLPTSYAGNHQRTQFSIRNSRFGFRFRAPEYHAIRASANLEFDFLGSWANPTYISATGLSVGSTGQPTENQFFTNPVLRVRHAYLKIETPVVDLLLGQYWHLYGWQPVFQPNTVQLQGIPGELYARTPQMRVSKTFASKDVTFDIALAAMRPPQRDSGYPEGEAGVHVAFNRWVGVQTIGATATQLSPAQVALTSDLRNFEIPNLPSSGSVAAPVTSPKSSSATPRLGGSIAADAYVPIISATKEHKSNSLSIMGEFSYGYGNADMYTGLVSGLSTTGLVPPPTGSPAGTVGTTPYNPQIDPGLALISGSGTLTLIGWETVRAGLQYYFPGLDGRMWLFGNYALVNALNAASLISTITPAVGATPAVTNASSIRNTLNWFDLGLMGDLTPAVRLGLEYAYSTDKYQDGNSAPNHRVQGSAFFIF